MVTGHFSPTPIQSLGRFGPIPFKSGSFGLISGVGPRLAGKYQWWEFPAVITVLGNTPVWEKWEILGNMNF